MKKYLLICMIILSPAFTASAQAPDYPQFAADVHLVANGKATSEGTFKTGKLGSRMDISMGGMNQTQIFRFDKDVIWAVMKDMGFYMEMPLQFSALTANKWKDSKENCVGEEIIDSHPTQKCEVSVTLNGKTFSSTVWKAKDLKGVVIKNLSADGSGMELKNIRFEPQPDSLFAEPTNLKKMDIGKGPADMMKAMMGK